ncbi:MAG: hypothetical protein AAF310_01135 [Myxococcota bacterium]
MQINTTRIYFSAVRRYIGARLRCSHALLACALLGTSLLLGCRNPCKELADKVCSCKSTLAQQQVCQTNMSARKRFYEIPRTENESECQRILDAKSCTCKALDRNEIDKCGMTRELPTQQEGTAAPAAHTQPPGQE